MAFIALVSCAALQGAALAMAAFSTRTIFEGLHAERGLDPFLLGWLGAAAILAAVAQFGLDLNGERMAQSFAASIRSALFEHASRTSQSDLSKRRIGYHFLRFSGDLSALTTWPSRGLTRLIQASALLPAAVFVLWVLHPGFALVAGTMVVATIVALCLSFRGLKETYKTLRYDRARLAADMAERVPVAAQLTALGRREKEHTHLKNRTGRVMTSALRTRRFGAVLELSLEALAAITVCTILWIGAQNSVPPSHLAAALAALALTLRPLRHSTTALQQRAAYLAAHDKLRAALSREISPVISAPHKIKRGPLSVSFVGDTSECRVIDAGAHMRMAADVLERLTPVFLGTQPVERGKVALNGTDLCDLPPEALGRRVGVVTDAPLILKGSLRKNLTLTLKARPSDTVILERIDQAGLTDVMGALGPLSRSVQERGSGMTRDQRLDLCLLRLAVQRPGLILNLMPDLKLPDSLSKSATVMHL